VCFLYYLNAIVSVQALSLLLRCRAMDWDESIELAIETVARSKDAHLVEHLVAFLMGDADGVVKVEH